MTCCVTKIIANACGQTFPKVVTSQEVVLLLYTGSGFVAVYKWFCCTQAPNKGCSGIIASFKNEKLVIPFQN